MGMQSQVKIFCCLALFKVVLSGPFAVEAAELDWSALSNDKLKIMEYSSAQGEVISSYIPYAITVGRAIWEWDPRQDELKFKTNNDKEVTRRNADSTEFGQTMRNLFVNFDVSDASHFRQVWIEPKAGLKFRGLFGIHDFKKPRPLVIIRMGIYGNVDEFNAERFIAKAVYEDLDANFLVLENITSHAFIKNNKDVSFGGVDEGLQTFFVLNELAKSSFAKQISSFHLIGLSLGGHGTFVTLLMDQFNGQKLKSAVALCPVINLKETSESRFSPGVANAFVDMWNMNRLSEVYNRNKDSESFSGIWKTFFDLKPRFTPAVNTIINKERKTPLLTVNDLTSLMGQVNWPKGFEKHLTESKSFDELNNYWSLYQGVKTPLMIYTTPNDPLVPNELNSDRIFSARQAGDFTSMKYQKLETGIHCGLASAYKWSYIVQLMKKGLEL